MTNKRHEFAQYSAANISHQNHSHRRRRECATEATIINQSFALRRVVLRLHVVVSQIRAQLLVNYPSCIQHPLPVPLSSYQHYNTDSSSSNSSLSDKYPITVLHFVVFVKFVSLVKQDAGGEHIKRVRRWRERSSLVRDTCYLHCCHGDVT